MKSEPEDEDEDQDYVMKTQRKSIMKKNML